MFDGPAPIPPESQLPADAYWHLVRTLRLTLPPPPDESPEALSRRDHAAILRIAALAPANAAEADVAAQFVAASEQWKDCLRLAQAPETTPEWAAKCRAQALGMMRQANGALRLLLRLQQARRRLEADSAAADRLTWTEHCAAALMAEALAAQPLPAESAKPAPPAGSEPPDSLSRNAGKGRGEGADEGPGPDLIAAAERYAATYPERAASIRRTGRLPCDVVYFDPPEASLARALVAGRSPRLAALDQTFPEACPDTGARAA